ncbi:MAG: 2-oxoacid:acceptor oxidoreductase family protein [Bacillota bacterium]
MQRFEIRLSGSGGQGLITGGIILAEAAAVYDDINAIQSQSYGPEQRGGASKSDVVISNGEIDYPKVTRPDVLLAMTQESCDKYAPGLKPGGLLILDSTYVSKVPTLDARVVEFPISQAAREAGREIVANIVALGVVAGLTGIVTREALEKAVLDRVPRGTEELNRRALARGYELAESVQG